MSLVKSKDSYVVPFDVSGDLDGWDVHLLARRGQTLHTLPVDVVTTTATSSTVQVTLPGPLTPGTWKIELVSTRGGQRITYPTDDRGRPQTIPLTIERSLDD